MLNLLQRVRPGSFGLSIALTALTALSAGNRASADQPELIMGPDPMNKKVDCGPNDPDCHKHLNWLEASVKILTFQGSGGVTFDANSHTGGAVKFSAQVINGETKSGDGQVLLFDVAYLGDSTNTTRIRVTLADTEAVFICKDSKGDVT